MITYVDTSTLLKLVVEESGSDVAAVIWDSADALASVGLVGVGPPFKGLHGGEPVDGRQLVRYV